VKKTKTLTIIFAEMLILLALSISMAFAEELKGKTEGSLNALNSGYAITTWPLIINECYVGDNITVRAATTEPPYPEAIQVVFRWHQPDGNHTDVGPIPLMKSNDTWDGKPIWDAYATQTLNVVGEWGVQALFLDENGKLQGPNPYAIVAIKATSCIIIPEMSLNAVLTAIWMSTTFCAVVLKRRKAI
jgi:hypothetical protein